MATSPNADLRGEVMSKHLVLYLAIPLDLHRVKPTLRGGECGPTGGWDTGHSCVPFQHLLSGAQIVM